MGGETVKKLSPSPLCTVCMGWVGETHELMAHSILASESGLYQLDTESSLIFAQICFLTRNYKTGNLQGKESTLVSIILLSKFTESNE